MINDKIKEKALLVNRKLEEILPVGNGYAGILYDAMRYSVLSNGKRLRPALLLLSAEAFNRKDDTVIVFAAALEMIHAYSLIHDDLPALDNDDLRRGKPTNHKVYGENIAILAGDGLLNFSYECMAKEVAKNPTYHTASAMYTIAEGSGIFGMIAGQTQDVITTFDCHDKDSLSFIQKNKTAKLISAAIVAGAQLGGANEKLIKKLYTLGENVGIAYQIHDDILDEVGDMALLGKPTKSDEKNQKFTDIKLYGLEESIKRCNRFYDQAIKTCNEIVDDGYDYHFLIDFINEVRNRKF